MKKISSQKGFAHLFLILGLAILGLTIFLGSGGLSRFNPPSKEHQVLGEEKNQIDSPAPSLPLFRR